MVLSISQIAIQNQIEALQQQQQALYQQQLASNQVLSFQTPGLAPNRGAHRRVQSTAPMSPSTGATFGNLQNPMGQFGNLNGLNLGLDGQSQGIPRGHGRRHSVNVVKGAQPGIGSISYPYSGQDGFDDGFAPPSFNGHSRQVSRADSSWRISESSLLKNNVTHYDNIQMVVLVVFKVVIPLLLTSHKPRLSSKACSNSVLQLGAITTRWLLSVSQTCYRT